MLISAVVTFCLLVLSAAGRSEAVQKRWVRTWDLDSLDNWQGRRIPCAGKAAILDRYPQTSMFLGDLLTIGSLELPVEGELIFGDGANMVFDDVAQDGCQDATWTHRGTDHWYDPDSWEYPGFPDPASSPVPHINRIPCTRDGALFTVTTGSVYTVHLSPPPISVNNLSIGTKNFTTSEFAAFTRTTEGKFRFVGVSSSSDNAPLYVESPEDCRDVTGCLCGIEDAASIICRITSSKCARPQCHNPIQMTGFCCPVCGAEVTISHNGTLPLASVLVLLKDYLNTPAMQHVSGYATKMADGHFHVYFTAVNENGDYKTASEAFKTKFEQELNMGKSHEALIAYSGGITPSDWKSVSPHNVAATFITLAVCLALGVMLYYLHKRRATSKFSFMFRRLESNSRRVSVVSDVMGRRPSTTSSVFTYSREGGLRFLNPIFNQSMACVAAAGLTSVSNEHVETRPEEEVKGERENPMYTAYQNMTPEEQQATEDTVRARERVLEAAGRERVLEAAGRERVLEAAGREKVLEAAGRERVLEAAGREKVLEAAGRERVLEAAGREKVLEAAGRERVLEAAGRERVLEAASELVASIDYSAVHKKEVKTRGAATRDLGVIEEERETKKETNNEDEGARDNTENIDDDNKDPLGAAVASFIEEDKNGLDLIRYQAKNEVKPEESKENPSTESVFPQKEYSSGKVGSKSVMSDKVPLDVDTQQADESPNRRELAETDAAPAQPTNIVELDNSFSSSSSDDDNASAEIGNLEGFTPSVNMMNFGD